MREKVEFFVAVRNEASDAACAPENERFWGDKSERQCGERERDARTRGNTRGDERARGSGRADDEADAERG